MTRKPLTDDLPEWHKKPFVLTMEEIDDPLVVFLEFFSDFTLAEIRQALKAWFFDTLHEDNISIQQHALTYEAVNKVIEAAFMIVIKTPGHPPVLDEE